MDARKWFIVLLVLTLVCGFIIAPIDKKPAFVKDVKITLGIDLVGGAELTYRILYENEAQKNDKQMKPSRVIDILRDRIDRRGLKEPRINQLEDDQIVIQIAVHNQDDLNAYKELLNTVGKLEEREVGSKELHEQWKATGYDLDQVPDGWRWIKNNRKMGGQYDFLSHDVILVSDKVIITGADVKYAGKSRSLTGKGWQIDFELTDEGAKKFDSAAKRLYNQDPNGLSAIILDGKIISKPVIQAEKYNGKGNISGDFSEKSAEDLKVVLSSGQLPIGIGRMGPDGKKIPGQPEAETFIGPTLAQDSLSRGLAAAAVGLILVVLFLIIYYRGAGFVAVFTLVCTLTYLMTIMALFGATLTLPGLAGIVLTVGLAVDANILVFERIREEMAKGKTALQAFESGHEKALSAIIDANITTLIAAGVLYYFGTGPVKGFATVLGIGILTTIFSVLVVGKVMVKLLIQAGAIREFKMMRIWSKTNVNFVRIMPACIFISMAAVLGGVAIFGTRVDDSLGMDFKGGTRLSFRLNDERGIEYVRDRVKEIQGPDGKMMFADAEVTAQADDEKSSATQFQLFAKTSSRLFQVRSSTQKRDLLQLEIQKKFRDEMSHVPFERIPEADIPDDVAFDVGGDDDSPAAAGVYVFLKEEGYNHTRVKVAFQATAKEVGVSSNEVTKEVNLNVSRMPDSPKGLVKLRVLFSRSDIGPPPEDPKEAKTEPEIISKWRDKVEKTSKDKDIPLSRSPFTSVGRIGPAVAEDLIDSTVWALIIGWFLMIIYIAIRFTSWKFGLAAVLALIHDAAIAIGAVALCGLIVPTSWGLSFEMNVVTVAALLTIVGYSVNDTIVLFDRIRENTILMKRDTFKDIINTSINQTMSRTILTSFSTFMVVVVLYVFTMTSAGGVAEFAFPMIVGVLIGTYSSIYVASSSVMWLFRGKKPQTSK